MFNMTKREAYQRAAQNGARIQWDRDWQEYIVTLNEWRGEEAERKSHHTDDLEDAVLTAGAMRAEADRQKAA